MRAITKKKAIKWIWIVGGILFVVPVLLLISGYTPSGLKGDILGFGLISGFLLLLINLFLTFKYYNLIIAFIFIELIGISLKLFHFPGSVILLLGNLLIVIAFVIALFNFLKKNALPKYINQFGIAASLIAAFTFLALFFIINNYSGGKYMDYISVAALIIIILALVFTLPSSGFVDWSKQARTVFFKALMVPIAFLFIYTATLKLYPNVFHLASNDYNSSFFSEKVVQFNKEGLAK